MSLNKHQIFAAKDLKESFVEVPEWGGKVKIRALSVKEQLEYSDFLKDEHSEIDTALKLLLLACITDDNQKLFDENDIDNLKAKNADNIFLVVNEIVAMNKQKADDIDNLAKNS